MKLKVSLSPQGDKGRESEMISSRNGSGGGGSESTQRQGGRVPHPQDSLRFTGPKEWHGASVHCGMEPSSHHPSLPSTGHRWRKVARRAGSSAPSRCPCLVNGSSKLRCTLCTSNLPLGFPYWSLLLWTFPN
jgi:hypothetical protein